MAEIKADEIKADNPAGRLYQILTATDEPQQGIVRVMWSKVFGFKPQDETALAEHLVQLRKLVAEVKEKLTEVQHSTGMNFLESFNDIERVVRVAIVSDNWDSHRGNLNPRSAAMANLRRASEYLSKNSPEQVINQDDLSEIQKDLDSLLDTVIKSEHIDAELRRLLLRNLRRIHQAIWDYKMFGPDILREAFYSALGETVVYVAELDKDEAKQKSANPQKEEEEGKVIAWFLGFLKKYGKIVLKRAILAAFGVASLEQLIDSFLPDLKEYFPMLEKYVDRLLEDQSHKEGERQIEAKSGKSEE